MKAIATIVVFLAAVTVAPALDYCTASTTCGTGEAQCRQISCSAEGPRTECTQFSGIKVICVTYNVKNQISGYHLKECTPWDCDRGTGGGISGGSGCQISPGDACPPSCASCTTETI